MSEVLPRRHVHLDRPHHTLPRRTRSEFITKTSTMQLHLRISALLATLLVSARSYMTAPPVASSFTPRMVAPQRSASSRSSGASITMKKGKPNVPIQQRGGYVQREKMMDQMGQVRATGGACACGVCVCLYVHVRAGGRACEVCARP